MKATAAMPKRTRITVRDLEQETKKFLAPATEKEASILQAAIALISERGIDGATTAEIAKHANVTEKTLFRYFPSKQDLVRRVLFPLLLQVGLMRNWTAFEGLLGTTDGGFRSWYVKLATDRLGTASRNPGLVRTVLTELLVNDELRAAMETVWRQHIWRPMVAALKDLQANGAIRTDINVEVLARAIHCLQLGYFLARYIFVPDRQWDDASQIDKMADILSRGSSSVPRRARYTKSVPAAE
jgi:TetR/AcrR family transcriptional regulator